MIVWLIMRFSGFWNDLWFRSCFLFVQGWDLVFGGFEFGVFGDFVVLVILSFSSRV